MSEISLSCTPPGVKFYISIINSYLFFIQAYKKAKIERIKERTEECTKINAKVQRLLATQEGRSKPLSTKEAIMSIKSLTKDFSKITTGIRNDAVFVKALDKP